MPPALALLLCVVFIAYLLRIDGRESVGLSPALWIPTIWFLLCASKPLGVWFQSAGNPDDGSSLDRNFLLILLAGGLITLVRRRFAISRTMAAWWPIILLMTYMLVSITWSDIMFISFKRWIRELVAVVMVFTVISESDPRSAALAILRRSVYVLIPLSILLVRYFPAYGVEFGRWSGDRMWIGVCTQKNGLGRLCLVSGFFLIWTLWRRHHLRISTTHRLQRYSEFFLLLLVLILMKGPGNSYSATSVATLVIGLLLLTALSWAHRVHLAINRLWILTLIAFVFIYGTITPFQGGLSLGVSTAAVGREANLTGRTDIWAALMPAVSSHIAIGHGVGGFWTEAARDKYTVTESHNGYLDVLLDLGFAGLALIFVVMLHCTRNAQHQLSSDFTWGCLVVCLLTMLVIHNLTEASINSLAHHLTAVCILTVCAGGSPALSRSTDSTTSLEKPERA